MTKYGAKKVVVNDIKFDSKMESNYYLHLLELEKQGIVTNIELQPVYELLKAFVINEKKIQGIKYKADFLVTYASGHSEVVDVKGFETADFKIKKKLFMSKYQQNLKCVSYSIIDGGWIELDQLKKNRAARRKIKNKK